MITLCSLWDSTYHAQGMALIASLARTNDDELAEMGCHARQAWCAYLNPVVWPEQMERCVRERIENGI